MKQSKDNAKRGRWLWMDQLADPAWWMFAARWKESVRLDESGTFVKEE